MMKLRDATVDDAASLREIYAPSVLHSVASFEAEVPTIEDMASRLQSVQQRFPWLVAHDDVRVLGYVYAGPHRARAAYAWSVEVSAYIHAEAQGKGLGKRMSRALLHLLTRQGFVMAFAGITLPNPASVGLYQSLGFQSVGVYPSVGFKRGAWHDVGWWSRCLVPPPSSPRPVLAPAELRERGDWQRILAEA